MLHKLLTVVISFAIMAFASEAMMGQQPMMQGQQPMMGGQQPMMQGQPMMPGMPGQQPMMPGQMPGQPMGGCMKKDCHDCPGMCHSCCQQRHAQNPKKLQKCQNKCQKHNVQ